MWEELIDYVCYTKAKAKKKISASYMKKNTDKEEKKIKDPKGER